MTGAWYRARIAPKIPLSDIVKGLVVPACQSGKLDELLNSTFLASLLS